MSIYICNNKNYRIDSVITGHDATIVCLIWSPINENLIASASVDGNFYIWDIFEEKAKVHVTLPSYPLMMQWSRANSNHILMLLATGDVKLLNLEERKVEKVANFSSITPTILRWHPKDVYLIKYLIVTRKINSWLQEMKA